MNYRFEEVVVCNMCNSPTDQHRILGRRMNKSQGKNPHKKTGITVTVLLCKTCGLIFCSPQPIPINIQDHYGIPPESYWKGDYFNIEKSYFRHELEMLNSLLVIKPNMKSLDVGAGIGKAMIRLNEVGFDAHGIEVSNSFYDRAILEMQISPDKLILGKIEDTDYPNEYFDFITFGVVLEHLYNPAQALERALRWLKPEGVIHIEVPSSRWLVNKLINLFYRIRLLDYVGNLSPMHEPFHLFEFDINSFNEHGKTNGYFIASHEYYVCQTYMPKVVDPLIRSIMHRTGTGMQLCVWLRKK